MGGADAFLIPLVTAAAGTAVNYGLQSSAQADAQDERNRELATQAAITERTAVQNNANTVKGAEQYQPQQRMENLDEAGVDATKSLTDYLRMVEGRDSGPQIGGKLTDDYLKAKGEQAASDLRYGRNLASLMGRAQAGGDLQRREGFNNANTAVTNATNSSDLRGELGVSNTRLGEIQPDGTKLLLGDLIGTGATLYAGSKLSNPAITGGGSPGFVNPKALGLGKGSGLRYSPATIAGLYSPKSMGG